MIHLPSYILLPGHDPGSLDAARNSNADLVVFDFEDTVPDGEKPKARLRVRSWLETEDVGDIEIGVRINALDTGFDRVDRTALAGTDIVHIILPKIEKPEDLTMTAAMFEDAGVGEPLLHVVIETPAAVDAVGEIASSGVSSLLVGAFDLAKTLGIEPSPSGKEILDARQKTADAAKQAQVSAFDMPFTHQTDISGFEDHISQSKFLGFTGCCAMNAEQVSRIKVVFSPRS